VSAKYRHNIFDSRAGGEYKIKNVSPTEEEEKPFCCVASKERVRKRERKKATLFQMHRGGRGKKKDRPGWKSPCIPRKVV